MKEVQKEKIIELFKKKGFDPGISWFCVQFKDKFKSEYNLDEMNFDDAYKNLIDFLRKEKIEEVLFFPEPDFESKKWYQAEIPNAYVKIEKLKDFLKEHVNTFTNCHIADKDLRWIFTITHEDDFVISGTKKLTQEFIKFFKGATIMSRAEIEAKWNKKKTKK